MAPVRTVVLCDTRMHREAVAMILGREEAPACIAEARPDVVLVDIAMAGAPRVIGRIGASDADVSVLAAGVHEDENSILECVEAGAAAYTTREASLKEVAAAVVRLARGEVLCSPWMLRLAAHAVPAPTRGARLTPRECEVVALIGEGLANKQIARRLGIELSTVKNHVHNILDKLDVGRRSDAAARMRARRV